MNYTFGNHSDVGKKRKINQDSFGTAKNDWGEIFVVADGMGGHKGGEVASQITVDCVCNAFKNAGDNISPAVLLDRSIHQANDLVSSKAKEDPELEGMGTTIVAVIIKDEEAHIAHVGDSRGYIFRNNQPVFKTKDHSFVQDLVDQGLISEEDAETHPKKNQILQAIGAGEIQPDISTQKLFKDDYILLCSDGLSGEVNDPELLQKLKSFGPMDACKNLVDLANERGGPDNITVIAVHIEKGKKSSKHISKEERKPIRFELMVATLVLIVLGVLTYNYFLKEEKPIVEIKITKPDYNRTVENDTTDTTNTNQDTTDNNSKEKPESKPFVKKVDDKKPKRNSVEVQKNPVQKQPDITNQNVEQDSDLDHKTTSDDQTQKEKTIPKIKDDQ